MPANSTSIVTLAGVDPADTPSIVTVGDTNGSPIEARGTDGEPAAGQDVHDSQLLVLSGSILASGPDAIPVAPERVASVDNEAERPTPRWIGQALPTIIRGGVHGDTIASKPASVPAAPATEEAPAGAPALSPR